MRNHQAINWLLSAGFVMLLSSCNDFSKLQRSGTDDEKYKAAVAYYKKSDWYRAGVLFEELIPRLRGSTESETAQFYYAHTQYNQELYAVSAQLFKRFYETFARSDDAQEATYMYALSLYKDTPAYNLDQSNTVVATAALQDFINTYPETTYRDACTKMIVDLRQKLEQKAYDKAKLYYRTSGFNIASLKSSVVTINNFQREFPDSKFNEELAFLKVDAQFSLAQNSLDTKQKERFRDAMTFFTDLKEKYPDTKFLRQAERMNETSQKELARIDTEEKELEKLRNANRPAKASSAN
jgi:outer membrane protein assembly factor BamD